MSGKGVTDEADPDIAPEAYLKRLGEAGDGPRDIATAALMLAALDHPEKKLGPYRAHLAEVSETAKREAGFARDAEGAARSLGAILAGRYGYDGERMAYDDPANADLISVIDRRRGLPVALGVLYIHAARAAGIEACGLFAPGHFLLRISVKGNEATIDAFNGAATLERERLTVPKLGAASRLADPTLGEDRDPFEPVTDIDVLLRLLNNQKGRAIQARDTPRVIELSRRMAMIAPKRSSLSLDLARMQEAAGSLSAARISYEQSLKTSRPGDATHNEATLALAALKRRLN